MTSSRSGDRDRVRRGAALVAAVVAVVSMAAVGVVGGAAPAGAQTDGLRLEADATYEVDPAAGVVRVAVELVATNEIPPQTSGGIVREAYFDALVLPVLAEATGFVAVGDGGRRLAVRSESAGEHVATAVVDLSPDLFYRDTQRVRVTYVLPSLPPRADGFTRVNGAFATFVAFTAGDPGLASVEIAVPDAYEVETNGADLDRDERDGRIVLSADAIDDPATWGVTVVARDDARLLSRDVSVLGSRVVVRAWPDDPEWADFVDGQLRDGLPALVDLVGRAWPDRTLRIVETASPYLYGYAGWYRPDDNLIEIGDALDALVILHELSHIWFNDRLFAQRWANEGFAEELASRTIASLGDPLPAPDPVVPGDPGAIRLNDWSQPNFQDDRSDAQELFGYNASWHVIRTIADEIGVEALSSVVEAAAEQHIAYAGDPEPERDPGAADWRRLLDLVELVGGSEHAVDLFGAYVVSDDDAPSLVRRVAARKEYDDLVRVGDGWSPPYAVRISMANWGFERAQTLMEVAHELLDARDALGRRLDALALALPDVVEEEYESARDLDDFARRLDEYDAATDAIVVADRAIDSATGPFATIGLWGADPNGARGEAVDRFEGGDPLGASASALRAADIADGAVRAGQQRAAAGLLVLLALTGIVLVRRRRRRRHADAAKVLTGP